MAAFITVHLQIFKRPQLPHFSTDLAETGIKLEIMKNKLKDSSRTHTIQEKSLK